MITCLIIGEINTIKTIAEYISILKPLKLCTFETSVKKGLNAIMLYKPDIVYIEAAFAAQCSSELNMLQHKSLFVIISDYNIDYEAFGCLAVDAMIKPVKLDRFKKGIEKFGSLLSRSEIDNPEDPEGGYFIVTLNKKSSELHFRYSELLCIEAMENYVKLYHVNGESYIIKITMKGAEERLPPNWFSRIHRSYIVNDNYVSIIMGNWVYLNDQKKTKVPIGSAYRLLFINKDMVREIAKKTDCRSNRHR